MPQYNYPGLSGINNPYSMRPFQQLFQQNRGVGLTGLDPKFITDPRFDYEAHLGMNPEEVKRAPVALLGNPVRDDYDSAPVGVKSQLAADQSITKMIQDMQGKSIGPSAWFTQNTQNISKGQPVTPDMAEEMRQRILMTRNRIEDRY